jgi:NIMA-interacting peptidyl-prolyl cis-trans isomerase 1
MLRRARRSHGLVSRSSGFGRFDAARWARGAVARGVVLAGCGLVAGCTTLTSSPSWVGGTLATGAVERAARENAALEANAKAIVREPKTIRARHLLVMHDGSDRKPPTIQRTRTDAKSRAEEALAKVRAGAKFEEVVAAYSDEPGAAERGGDLDVFEKKSMVKAFSDAAFKLEVGQVSEVVETPFGFHVIQRTE